MADLPEPSIRVDAFGDILPADGRKFVMGDFYTADQLTAHAARVRAEAMESERQRWLPFALTLAHALDRGDDPALLMDENSPIRDELRRLIDLGSEGAR